MASGDLDAGFVLACILTELALAYAKAMPPSASRTISFVANELVSLSKPRVEIEHAE